MTIGQLLADTQYGQKTILQKLIMHYCALSREQMWMQSDTEIADSILQSIVDGYSKYVDQKMPLEYIVGKVTFLGNDFVVSEHTLIPRPETEYMIETINEYILVESTKYKVQSDCLLLDVGTGCGVLGLSVLLHNPTVFGQAILSDMSADALDVAKRNYSLLESRLQTTDYSVSVLFVHGSLVEYLQNPDYRTQIAGKNVVLVANLPYIPDEMFDTNVDETVKKWEPRMAFV
jgi:release factor glutamine methyltransferase